MAEPLHTDATRAAVVEEIARDFEGQCQCPTPDPPCLHQMVAAIVRTHAREIGGRDASA
jgi:hypothetical protein